MRCSQENYDKWYDRAVCMGSIGIDMIRDKADVLMKKYMVEELQDPCSYDWWGKTWSMESGHGQWSVCHGQYAGFVTNASMEREWREDKEPCSPKASMGEYLGARCATIKAKGMEHRQRLIDQKTPNRFISYPKISKDMWDFVQGVHPKTLVLAVLMPQSGDDDSPALFARMTQQIYEQGEADTLLHVKIAKWHADNARRGVTYPLALSKVKCLFQPRQRLLKQVDPDNALSVSEVRDLIAQQLDTYTRLTLPADQTYTSLSLDTLLDVDGSFLHIDARGKEWSAVAVACSCRKCYKFTVCGDAVLLGMCFNAKLKVPGNWEQAEPSLRKARGRRGVPAGRGIAGVKRRLSLMKAIQKSTSDGIKKSAKIKIKGPLPPSSLPKVCSL